MFATYCGARPHLEPYNFISNSDASTRGFRPSVRPYDPNDAFSQASGFNISIRYAAEVNPQGDYDYYYIDVTQPGLFGAILRVQNTTVDVELGLYDSTYQRKSWGAAGVGNHVHLDFSKPVARTLLSTSQTLQLERYTTLQLRPTSLHSQSDTATSPADWRYYLRT